MVRGTDALFGLSLVALLAGRLAVAHDEEPGALFYVVGPAALALGALVLLVATRLAERLRSVLYPLAGAVVGFVFAAAPGSSDGPIAVGYLLGGGVLAVVALAQARTLPASRPATRRVLAGGAALLAVAAVGVAVAALVLLVLLSATG